MQEQTTLRSAAEMAKQNKIRIPNETSIYRHAREALLAEEIGLRRHIERVAEQRRALPPGGAVTKDYRFMGREGPTSFEELFGAKLTLVVYSFMFGPTMEKPCPMCTSLLSAWAGEARDIEQNVALVIVARSPIERLTAFATARQWKDLRLVSDMTGDYSRDYMALADDGSDIAAINVFTRRDGTIRHFWSGEMGPETVDPGQDGRGAPDLMPLWNILDMTPEGRKPDWYPKLAYGPTH